MKEVHVYCSLEKNRGLTSKCSTYSPPDSQEPVAEKCGARTEHRALRQSCGRRECERSNTGRGTDVCGDAGVLKGPTDPGSNMS